MHRRYTGPAAIPMTGADPEPTAHWAQGIMHSYSSAASIHSLLRFRRGTVVLLLALLGLFQVASASARTAARSTAIRPSATIPGTSFTWVTSTSPVSDGLSLDFAEDVAFLQDGRVAATGSVELASGQRVFAVAVYNRNGSLDWLRTVTGTATSAEDSGLHLAVDPTGNVVAVGYKVDALIRTGEPTGKRKKNVGAAGGPIEVTRRSIFAISYTPTGSERWRQQLDSQDDLSTFPQDMAIDSVGNVLITGTMDNFEAGTDFYVAKLLGSDGFVSWERSFDGSGGNDAGLSVAWAPSANAGEQDDVIAAGYQSPDSETSETIVYKIDGDLGAFNHWVRSVELNNEPTGGYLEDVVANAAGEVFVAGAIRAGFSEQFLVARLAGSTGDTVWTRLDSGNSEVSEGSAFAIALGPSGELAAAGYLLNDDTGYDAYVVRLDPESGNSIWRQSINGNGFDRIVDLAFDPSGGVVSAAQFTFSKAGSFTFDVYRHDENGEETWHRSATGTGEGSNQANAVAVDNFGNVGAAGFLYNQNTGLDFAAAYVDCQAPMLSSPSVTPDILPSTGGNALASVTAVDNVGLDLVEVVVTNPDTTESRFTMTAGSGNEYQKQLPFPANPTSTPQVYKLLFSARDATGNLTTLPGGTVMVSPADLAAPTIVSCQVTPTSLPFSGGLVNISAVVTDNIGVATVIAIVNPPTGPDVNVPLTRGEGDEWSGTYNVPGNTGTETASYGVQIQADDASGNSDTEVCDTVTVAGRDLTPPTISNPQISPTSLPPSGGQVVIRAMVTDAGGVDSVLAKVYLGAIPGSTRPRPRGGITPVPTEPVAVPMTSIGKDLYEGVFQAPPNEGTTALTYNVVVEARDTSNNPSSLAAGSFTVAAEVPGRLQLSHTVLNFGLVNLGKTARRTFRIRNIGQGLLTGEMTLPSLPFVAFIKEGKDLAAPNGKGGLFFTLDPGEVITVLVEFSPTVHARYGSEIRLITNDPKKKNPRVILKGLGCRVR